MRSRWIFCALLAFGLTAVAVNQADAARRSSLAGNFMFEDMKDIFVFPHHVVRYVNHVWFDLMTGQGVNLGGPASYEGDGLAVSGGDPHLGSGGILIGNAVSRSFGIGIATHRADFQGALAESLGLGSLGDVMSLLANTGYDNAFVRVGGGANSIGGMVGPQLALAALNWLDLLVGFSVAPKVDLGARVSIAHNLLVNSALEGNESGSPNPGASFTSVNILASLGYGETRDPLYFDAALEITIGKAAAEGLIPPDQRWVDEGSAFGFGLMGPGFMRVSESISMGAMAQLSYRSRGTRLYDPPGGNRFDQELAELMLQLAAGPRYTIGEKVTVAAYATIGILQATSDPEGRRNVDDNLYFMVPGLNIAGEFQLTDWFAYRVGLASYYQIHVNDVQQEVTDFDDTGGYRTAQRVVSYYWSNGIGLNALEGSFTMDAMLNWPVIVDGPFLLSGRQQGAFAMVNVGYSF